MPVSLERRRQEEHVYIFPKADTSLCDLKALWGHHFYLGDFWPVLVCFLTWSEHGVPSLLGKGCGFESPPSQKFCRAEELGIGKGRNYRQETNATGASPWSRGLLLLRTNPTPVSGACTGYFPLYLSI